MQSVCEIFEKEKIEYFAPIAYSEVKTINERLLGRVGFEPKSAIIFLVPYYSGETVNISRYAASLDYHVIIKAITSNLIGGLKLLYPNNNFCGFGDHSPINENHAALVCGLGIAGDNGLIINEKYGSYVFVADILTDLAPDMLGAKAAGKVAECRHCGACRRACPTGILSGAGEDCISAITQRKGELSETEIEFMRRVGTVWGCDVCQSVCPYNLHPVKTPIPTFYEKRIDRLDSQILSDMSDEDFELRAFAWRGRKVVERNLEKMGI